MENKVILAAIIAVAAVGVFFVGFGALSDTYYRQKTNAGIVILFIAAVLFLLFLVLAS